MEINLSVRKVEFDNIILEGDKDHSCVDHLWGYMDYEGSGEGFKALPPETNFGQLLELVRGMQLDPNVIEKLFSVVNEVNDDRSFNQNPFMSLYWQCSSSRFDIMFDEHLSKIENGINRKIEDSGCTLDDSQEMHDMKQHMINVSEQKRIESYLVDLQRQLVSEYIELRYRQKIRGNSTDQAA